VAFRNGRSTEASPCRGSWPATSPPSGRAGIHQLDTWRLHATWDLRSGSDRALRKRRRHDYPCLQATQLAKSSRGGRRTLRGRQDGCGNDDGSYVTGRLSSRHAAASESRRASPFAVRRALVESARCGSRDDTQPRIQQTQESAAKAIGDCLFGFGALSPQTGTRA